jgi:hypothetical protein
MANPSPDRERAAATYNSVQSMIGTATQNSRINPIPGSIIRDNGLPSSSVKPNNAFTLKRNAIYWSIPTLGVVRMFINPQSIRWDYGKNITETQTKGGWSVQYLAENLTKMNVDGHTGTSGFEGINVLHELYRAEQYAFDNMGVLISANSGPNVSQQIVNAAGSALNMLSGSNALTNSVTGVAQTLGIGGVQNNAGLPIQNMMTLADVAFGIEMFYSGKIYRGFFKSFTINENTEFLIKYTFSFVITQERGYRYNHLPWQRSATGGPSQYNTPYSFDPNHRLLRK